MKVNRRRRLMLWSLGMGMVAAFIQSRLAAARLAMSEQEEDGSRPFVGSAGAAGDSGGISSLCLQDWAWNDVAEASHELGRLEGSAGNLGE